MHNPAPWRHPLGLPTRQQTTSRPSCLCTNLKKCWASCLDTRGTNEPWWILSCNCTATWLVAERLGKHPIWCLHLKTSQSSDTAICHCSCYSWFHDVASTILWQQSDLRQSTLHQRHSNDTAKPVSVLRRLVRAKPVNVLRRRAKDMNVAKSNVRFGLGR